MSLSIKIFMQPLTTVNKSLSGSGSLFLQCKFEIVLLEYLSFISTIVFIVIKAFFAME